MELRHNLSPDLSTWEMVHSICLWQVQKKKVGPPWLVLLEPSRHCPLSFGNKSSGSCLSSVCDPFECTLDVTFGKSTSGLESHADLIEISLATTRHLSLFSRHSACARIYAQS